MSHLNDVAKQLDLIEYGQSVIERSKTIRAWAEFLAIERKRVVVEAAAARALRCRTPKIGRDVSLQILEGGEH